MTEEDFKRIERIVEKYSNALFISLILIIAGGFLITMLIIAIKGH